MNASDNHEIKRKRLRRNKNKRDKLRNMSKQEKRVYFSEKATRKLSEEKELLLKEMKRKRDLAVMYWKRWREEVKNKETSPLTYSRR